MLAVVGVAVPQVPPVPVTDGATATPFAAAPPPFVTVNVTVTACSMSTVAALAPIVAVSAEGSWTAMGTGWRWPSAPPRCSCPYRLPRPRA